MRSSRRRSSDGDLGQVALKAREYQAGGVSTAVDLAEILEKKDLSEHETKVIRESMVQVRWAASVSESIDGDLTAALFHATGSVSCLGCWRHSIVLQRSCMDQVLPRFFHQTCHQHQSGLVFLPVRAYS